MSDQIGIIGDKPKVKGGIHFHNYDAPPPVIPRDLQPLDACFLGRDTELAELVEQLQPGKVVAVCGPGGMGKSALAAQAVSRLEESRFPDGIIFHSFYGKPETEQALQAVCAAFQVEAKAGLASTVRQVLSGKKALLILDGTEEADDLKAVLALRSSCGVLITSRKRDDAQGFRLDLVPLEDEPAVEVLQEHSGLTGDDEAVQGICKILDGWPVGLRIAGRYLGSRGESPTDYLRWLKKRPFRKLRTGEHQEDNAALLLQRSAAQVGEDSRLVLGLAGTLAYDLLATAPMIALLEDDERRCRLAVNELVNYGLLERRDNRLHIGHALIHQYAATHLGLSKDALQRVAHYYRGWCRTQSAAGLPGYVLLDDERTHCLRLIATCLDGELWEEVKDLVGAIDIYLDRQGWWTEELAAWEMGLTAAQQTEDRRDEAWCLNSLGYTCNIRRDYEQALTWHKQCLPVRRELGDKKGEGATLNNIAFSYRGQGKYDEALEQYQQSLSVRREVGDRQGEGVTLNNIGSLYWAQDKYDEALPYYEQCLPIRKEAGDQIGVGQTLNNIATIYRAQGEPSKALEYHEQALAIWRELGDRAGEAVTCWNIGLTYIDMGDLARAEEYMALAVQIEEAIGHPDLENDRNYLEQVRAARQGA